MDEERGLSSVASKWISPLPLGINTHAVKYVLTRMKQPLTYDNLARWMSEAEDKVRKEMEDLGQRPDSFSEPIRQMIATHQGRLLALKDLRLRIRAETGVELKGTKAPPDVRKK
jgi:hypothetical protein